MANPSRFPLFTKLALCGLAVALMSAQPSAGQEFDCSVDLNYAALSGSNYSYIEQLGLDVEEYFNRQSFTTIRVREEERIDCEISVVFQEAITLTRFRAQLIVASRRPIYGTVQNTKVLQIKDDSWIFDYTEGTPLISSPDRFDPLTTILDYYAYIILGFDADTYAEFGGTDHFEKARYIADYAESSGATGWNAIGADRSRTDIVDEILDPQYKPFRQTLFDYHYQVLDHFIQDSQAAQASALEAIRPLKALSESVGRSYVLDLFFSAKAPELASVFLDSRQRNDAFEILSEIDPVHVSDYNRLIQ